jgi:hypothetical protein
LALFRTIAARLFVEPALDLIEGWGFLRQAQDRLSPDIFGFPAAADWALVAAKAIGFVSHDRFRRCLHSRPKLGSFRTFSLSRDPARLPAWPNWVCFA